MTDRRTHRLEGLEPDNLLAFMALLGLLRALEEARPDWRPRVCWTVDDAPLRPALLVPERVDETVVVEAVAKGLADLAARHDFDDLVNLKMSPESARERLDRASKNAVEDRYFADLWAALMSDAVTDDKEGKIKPTPLCLLGTGRTSFLPTLVSVSRTKIPSNISKKNSESILDNYLREALFAPWKRPDKTLSFRWDPNEDARYALRWRAPTDDKESTQHGANRLAAIGLSTLTTVPKRRFGKPDLVVLCGTREPNDPTIYFGWPIWREPISLAGIRALLGHPHLDRRETRAALGVVERRRARRISVGKYMNVTRAQTISERE